MPAPKIKFRSYAPDVKLPRAKTPEYDIDQAEYNASGVGRPYSDDPDVPTQETNAQPSQQELLKNSEAMYQDAVQRGEENDQSPTFFEKAPSFFLRRRVALPDNQGLTKASIARLSIGDIIKSLQSDETAGSIMANMAKNYAKPGSRMSLTNYHSGGIEDHLSQPRYFLTGDKELPAAYGQYYPDHGMAYWAGRNGREWFVPHEAAHATIEGDNLTDFRGEMFGGLLPNEMTYGEYAAFSPEVQKMRPFHQRQLGEDLGGRYIEDDGWDEVAADLMQWSHDSSDILGQPNRNKQFMSELRQRLMSGEIPDEDPYFKIGPRQGMKAEGYNRLQRALRGLLEVSPEEGKRLILDSMNHFGSNQPGATYG